MARVRGLLVTVACLVIGLGVARAAAYQHPASAPAAPTGGGRGYDYVALVVLAVVALAALRWYWNHRDKELRRGEADLDGFTRRTRFALRELWECPVCQALMRLEAVADHQDANYSLCAFFSAWLDEHEGTPIRQFIRGFSPQWGTEEDPPEAATYRASATMPPAHSVTGGGYDSIEE